jgi:hypothetical protein
MALSSTTVSRMAKLRHIWIDAECRFTVCRGAKKKFYLCDNFICQSILTNQQKISTKNDTTYSITLHHFILPTFLHFTVSLFLPLSICLSLSLYLSVYVCLSVCLSFCIFLSVCTFFFQYIFLTVSLYVFLLQFLFPCLSLSFCNSPLFLFSFLSYFPFLFLPLFTFL